MSAKLFASAIERGDFESDSPNLPTAEERAMKMFEAGKLNEKIIEKAVFRS